MRLLVRRAEREDHALLVQMIRELADFESLDPPDDAACQRLLADGWGDHPRFEAWLAFADGAPAAYAITFETYSSFLARPTFYLEDLFVRKDWRRHGVGRAIFERLCQEVLNRGCGRMEWICLDWNTRAQRFYESVGARRMDEWLSYRLMPDAIRAMLDKRARGDIDAG